MTGNDIFQIVLYFGVLLLLAKPLGDYMARVYENQPCGLDRVLGPVERIFYRLCGIRPEDEMDWKQYTLAVLVFSAASLLVVYLLQRLQGILPLNPQKLPGVSPDSSFNTAVSFATNTNWQGYGGESTMSYLTQMAGLAVQNFVSAASRDGCSRGPDPWVQQTFFKDYRQLLGGFNPYDSVHIDPAFADLFSVARFSRRGANLQRV